MKAQVVNLCRFVVDNQPLSQLISRLIADFLFSVIMEALFLFQVCVPYHYSSLTIKYFLHRQW